MSTSAAMAQQEQESTGSFRAPLFYDVVDAFDEDRRHFVLDLGRARSGTVELFSRYRCRLDVVDLPSRLDTLPVLEDGDDETLYERWLESLLPPARGEAADLVLCWNLLNYLSPPLIRALGSVLARRTEKPARLHALIEYSAREMPAEPPSVAPAGTELSVTLPEAAAAVAAPRYSPKDLEKLLPGFAIEKAMLLGNGMQEYLYRR
ncbi:MAG TPA: hypothetical protein VK064_08730 [Wenzhouxiangella sp.]|nr:hypothetical protein [Wenzhouxiangella sp.]